MEIDFKTDVVSTLPFEVGLCLFRVLQEAVHNSVKHSGVKRAEVQLMEHANEVHLTVEDRGKGFDLDAAREGRGLGLTSMQERVRLANGTIEVQAKPMGGTTIRVRVPIGSSQSSGRCHSEKQLLR
jgi:signal transduction histidine kinase